jgi:hypothetical protein
MFGNLKGNFREFKGKITGHLKGKYVTVHLKGSFRELKWKLSGTYILSETKNSYDF